MFAREFKIAKWSMTVLIAVFALVTAMGTPGDMG